MLMQRPDHIYIFSVQIIFLRISQRTFWFTVSNAWFRSINQWYGPRFCSIHFSCNCMIVKIRSADRGMKTYWDSETIFGTMKAKSHENYRTNTLGPIFIWRLKWHQYSLEAHPQFSNRDKLLFSRVQIFYNTYISRLLHIFHQTLETNCYSAHLHLY